MIETELVAYVDREVTLAGTARDAHQGAVVLLSDGTPVYILGLDCWDDEFDFKQIKVTGVLRERKLAPDPEIGPGGEVSHGMVGDSWVIEDAKWELLP